MCEIFGVSLTEEIEHATFLSLMNLLPMDSRRKLNRYYHYQDAQRGLVGELLTRYVIGKRGLSNCEFIFERNEFGKPFLKNNPEIHFNISHSENWVVCAMDSNVIGIDVEAVKPIDLQLARHFFTAKECEYIFSIPELQEVRFYEIWTLKESYIKAVGKGLTIPLDSFSIIKEDETYQLYQGLQDRQIPYYCNLIDDFDPSFKLALCTKSPQPPLKVNKVLIHELIRTTLESNTG